MTCIVLGSPGRREGEGGREGEGRGRIKEAGGRREERYIRFVE
jgi:hypothetical protein